MANLFSTFINSISKKKMVPQGLPSGFSTQQPAVQQPSQQKPATTTVAGLSGAIPTGTKFGTQPSVAIGTPNIVKSSVPVTNVGATGTKPTQIIPPSSNLPASGQQYVNGLAGNTPSNSNMPKIPDPVKAPKEQNAYLEYLKSVFNPEQLRTAQANAEALNQRTADEIKRTRDREDELRSNEIGQLKTGQDYQMGENQRLSNKSLADLAIAKGANTEVYNQMLNAGKSAYDAETAQQQFDAEQQTKIPASAQEYEYAKKQGYTKSFQEYQNEDANRKAVQQGLSPAQINTTVNSIAGAFDNEPIVKEFNTVKSIIEGLGKAGSSPTDDMQRIYAFAKVMDPNSAVKEGEYKTVQDYSTALFQRLGINVARAFDSRGFLTDEARTNMLTTLNNVYQAKQAAYDNLSQQYQRQIDDAYSGKNRTITNYGGTSSGGTGGYAEVW